MGMCGHLPEIRRIAAREELLPLLEVAVEVRRDQDHSVEQLLHDCVLILPVLLCDLGALDLGFFVDGDLCVLRITGMLCTRARRT